jgi:hypothetical protein
MGTPDAAHFPCLACEPQAASRRDLQAVVPFPANLYSITVISFVVQRANSDVQ